MFFSNNQKTALQVAEVRGAIIGLILRTTLSLHEYNPLDVKVAITGYGKANKAQVTSMIEKLIRTEKSIKLDDEYDAIGVALTHAAIHKTLL